MVEAILLNIVAQAIWELGLSPFLRGTARTPMDEADPERQRSRYGSSVEAAVEKLTAIESVHLADRQLVEFLSRREVQNLVTSLFIFRLDEASLGIEQARAEFVALWQREDMGQESAAVDAFTALLEAAEDAVGVALREGILSAHEARSSARHQMLLEHLDAMERRTKQLLEEPSLSMEEVGRFEKELRREVHARHGTITPPDFYGAPRVPIDNLYVMPNLEQRIGTEAQEPEGITVSEWLDRLQYGVVLGDPGGGKSTLASKLCHALSTDDGYQIAHQTYTPVVVTLREYSARRKDRGLSITEYIEELAATRYQLSVPEGAVEYLLLSGRLIVIFDGLDELLETRHRQEIRDDVESFQRRFPTTKLMVTSRAVGYEQAPLNDEVFQVVHLSEFTDQQVEEYAHKWFRLEKSLSAEEQTAKAEAFIEESRAVPDLRTNPLLLALMCNFYLGQNYLPRHLPEVYETCAKMLFETWDRSRGIVPVLPIAEHIRPAMRYLALWIYEDETLQGGASERELIEKAVEFLLEFRFEDEHEARSAAEAFIEFCAGRAWVFTDTGTTAEGEKLFQFTHRTFLEYFAADHLVASSETTEMLSERLAARIAAREWWVVSLVAYQLKSKGTLAAADQLLTDLIRRSEVADGVDARGNFVLFGVECLAFLVPSPVVVRALAGRAVDFLLSVVLVEGSEAEAAIEGIGPGLIRVGAETRRAVAQAAAGRLHDAIESGEEAAIAATLCIDELGRGPGTPEALVAWEEALGEVRSDTAEMRLALASVNRNVALKLAMDRELLISRLVELYGVESLFVSRPALLAPNGFYAGLLGTMAQSVLRQGFFGREDVASWEEMLIEAGAILASSDTPWATYSSFFTLTVNMPGQGSEHVPTDPAIRFGLALAIGCHIEERVVVDPQAPEWVWDEVKQSQHPFIQFMAPIINQRLGLGEAGDSVLEESDFTTDQKELLKKWCEKRIDFLQPPPDAQGPQHS